MKNTETTKMQTPRKYYFHESRYHHLADQKRDHAEMSEYGPVGYSDKWGWYWEVAQPKRLVRIALNKLGYELSDSR